MYQYLKPFSSLYPPSTKEREKFNIGLGLKFNKRNQELLGYARKTDAGWSFSTTAVALVREFMERFPRMFQYISANPGEDKYYESNLFPDPDRWVEPPLYMIAVGKGVAKNIYIIL